MLCQGRTSGRAGVGLDSSGQASLVKLQPFLDISAVFQRVATDTRVTSTLAAIMHDQPVLMPEKCKLNYKQRLAEGGEYFGLEEAPAAATRGGSDFGRFPIHNDYAYLLRSTLLKTQRRTVVIVCTIDLLAFNLKLSHHVLPQAKVPPDSANELHRHRRLHPRKRRPPNVAGHAQTPLGA